MPEPSSAQRYLSIDQAAEYLGYSRWTIRRRIADGTLPAHRDRAKNSRTIRILRDDLDAMLRPAVSADFSRRAQA